MKRSCTRCGKPTDATWCASCARPRERQKSQRRGPTGWARQRLTRAIIARDGGRCVICGSTDRLEVDHIVPLAQGGGNEPANLRTLCHDDHRKHGGGR